MLLARHADRLVFAKLIPIGVVGVYNIAVMLQQIPVELSTKLAQSVMFPVFSRAAEGRSSLGATFVRVRTPVLVLGGWMLAGLCGGGPAAVGLLSGSTGGSTLVGCSSGSRSEGGSVACSRAREER